MFETETILGPYGKKELADDIDSVNEFQRQKGLPVDWLLFHTGFERTVVKLTTGEYATLGLRSFDVQKTFTSLADWYANSMRPDHAKHYGLR